MRKIALFFAFIFAAGIAFADKSRFYKNGKVIDTMFVDATDGLRVREEPSLKGKKVCALQHRMAVKVVAVGKEVTLDGIKAPWVEIVVPKYEWKGDEVEFGWVFGGYLKKEQPKFTAPKTAAELRQYLVSVEKFDEYENDEVCYYKLNFWDSGRFWRGKDGSGIGEGGTWNAVSKDTVEFHTEYVMEFEDEYSWELKLVFESDGSFHFDAGESVNYCYPSFAQDNASVYSTTRHGNFIDWLADVKYWSPYDTPIEERVMELIKWGISAEGTKFEQMYHDYWNPIMAEHQKKADSGK